MHFNSVMTSARGHSIHIFVGILTEIMQQCIALCTAKPPVGKIGPERKILRQTSRSAEVLQIRLRKRRARDPGFQTKVASFVDAALFAVRPDSARNISRQTYNK